jgi:prephenate dehydrogenase
MEGHTVLACEKDEQMLQFAVLAGAVHGRLNEETIPSCDLILLAIYPDGSATWLDENAKYISKDTLVMDPVNHFFASVSPVEFVNILIMSASTGQSMD